MAHMERTAARLRFWCTAFGLLPVQARMLQQLHRLAARAIHLPWHGSPAPLQRLLRHRTRAWQHGYKGACLLPSRRMSTVGHLLQRAPGVDWAGSDWMQLTDERAAWRRRDVSFVLHTMRRWGMLRDAVLVEHVYGVRSALAGRPGPLLGLPWRQRGLSLAGPGPLRPAAAYCRARVSWKLRGDCKVIVEALNGVWCLEEVGAARSAGACCSRAAELLAGLWVSGAAVGTEEDGWLEWVPRGLNQGADFVANLVLDKEVSAAGWIHPGGLGLLASGSAGVVRGWFDGGLRPGGAGVAAAVLAWFPTEGVPCLLAWVGRACAAQVALEVEAAAVVQAAELLGRALRGCRGSPAAGHGWEEEVVAHLARWLGSPSA